MRLIILILLFPLVSFGQTKLSQLERASTRWDLPVAYRTVNGTYAQGYLGFLEYLDSINYSAGVVNVVIPGYGIEGFITNDTLVLYADTTELQRKLTLTTSGTSGAATLTAGTLNIPNYTLAGLGGVPTTRQITINGNTQDLSANRTWNVGTVTNVSALTLGTTGTDLSSTVANSTTTPVITLNVPTASATNRGALSSADWSTFNNKQAAITLTTTGTSGAATFIGNTLNIPQYSSGLSGTGTQYYVPRWATSSSLENSATPLWDYNGIVGIGQTGTGDFITNAYKFQVYQPSGALTTYHKATGTNNVFERYENPNAAWWHGIHTTNNWGVFGGGINFFNILYSGQVSISNLSGTGTRMVVASPSGVLSTQTIPAASTTSLFNTSITGGVKLNTTTQTNSGININSGTGISVAFTDAANMTITNTAPATATNLTFSGVASPFTLNSSTGTDVTFTAGSNITLTGTSTNLTIAATGGGSLPSGTQNQTLRHNGTTFVATSALQVINPAASTERVQAGASTFPLALNAGSSASSTDGTRLAVAGGIQLVPTINSSTGIAGLDANNGIARISVGAGLTLSNNTISAAIPWASMFNTLELTRNTDGPLDFSQGNNSPSPWPTIDAALDRFTINQTGVYEITFTSNVKTSNNANSLTLAIRNPSTATTLNSTTKEVRTADYSVCTINWIGSLTAGNSYEIYANVTSNTLTYNNPHITIKRIN